MDILAVKSGLIGCNHTRSHRCRHIIETNALRPFVHVEEVAHAVSGAVQIGQALLPQKLPCKYVKLHADSSLREHCGSQGDMAFHHQGEVVALFGRALADSYCARDVRGAVKILSAAVYQQQTAAMYLRIGLLGGVVVDDGSMRTEAGNGTEAFVKNNA